MDHSVETTLILNGMRVSRWIEPRVHLTDFLREEMGLTGSRVGCEHGACGACTVRVEGKIVRGCLMLAVQANGKRVDTCSRRFMSATRCNAVSARRACCWRRRT